MRIGLDARPLSRAPGGIHRLLSNTLRELERIDDVNEYYLYSPADVFLPFENPRWHKRLFSTILPRGRTLLFEAGVRSMILQDRLQLFWGTAHVLPLGLPPTVAKVLRVHDLVWHFYPETMAFGNYLMHRIFADRSIRMADKIITISETTRQALEGELGVARGKICVVYPAAEAHYKPHQKSGSARHIAERYHASESYICTVGTIEPRKNLITLVEALGILHQRARFPYQALVAGGSGWKNSKIYASVEHAGLTEREIKFLGHLPEEDLPHFYSGAALFVFPSLYEGFGLPLVEAMACGVPIVASNASSIPEVVQDAAILVSPHRPEDFADAIIRVLTDPELRSALVEKGIQRARRFRYDVAAQETLRMFSEVTSEVKTN